MSSNHKWDPNDVLLNATNHATLLLNYSIENIEDNNRKLFETIWTNSKFKIAVDGGANYLKNDDAKPNVVCGDFDSIDKNLLEKYKSSTETEVIETPDQDETDFTKAIDIVYERYQTNNNIDKIITFWSSGGRADQVLGNIHTLHKFINAKPFIPIYLIDLNNSLSWLLPQGSHFINSRHASKWCSLVPVGNPCIVTTNGFRWNLNNDKLSFGQLISTSNEFDCNEDHVYVKTDYPIFFSMDISK